MRSGKWRVPQERYPPDTYPFYCIGASYLMTGDVPQLLIRHMFNDNNNNGSDKTGILFFIQRVFYFL